MTDNDLGRSPDGSDYSAEPEPEEVSAVPVSIPNAALALFAAIDELTGVYDEPPGFLAYPYAQLQFAERVYGDDALLSLTIWDNEPARLHEIADAAEDVIEHATFKARLLRRRVVRDVAGPWAAAIDWRVKASGMEARQGGDAQQAPSSDDSPASEAGDAPTVEVRP